MTLAELLNNAMVIKNITPTELNEKCGFGRSYYYNLASQKSSPKLSAARKIAEVLDLDINDLAYCEKINNPDEIYNRSKLNTLFLKAQTLDDEDKDKLINIVLAAFPQLKSDK